MTWGNLDQIKNQKFNTTYSVMNERLRFFMIGFYVGSIPTHKTKNYKTNIMIYNTLNPSEMTQRELKSICADIQIAKNWNLPYATVTLKNGMEYRVDVERHSDYQKEVKTVTGAIPRGVGL